MKTVIEKPFHKNDKDWTSFSEIDPFNNNLVSGKISHHSGDDYGALFIEKVNNRDAPQLIYCTPKLAYPFDASGHWHFPKAVEIKRFEKLDGTNVFAYSYEDEKGNKFVSYKTRLNPFLKDSKFGPFKTMWGEILERYPKIKFIVLNRGCNLSFELWGARNPHLVKYEEALDASLLFERHNQKVCPCHTLTYESFGLRVAQFLGNVDRDYVWTYQNTQEEIGNALVELEDGGYSGQEGEVWYLLDERGNWHLYKCLDGKALVKTENGWMKIKHLVKERSKIKVATMLPDYTIGWKPITGWHYNFLGTREFYRIGFQNSKKYGVANRTKYRPYFSDIKSFYGINVTNDHLILTVDGYKKAESIEESDKGYTGNLAPNSIQREVIDGSLLGDGMVSQKGGFRVIQTDIEYIKFKQSIFEFLNAKGFFSGIDKHSKERKDFYTFYIPVSNWSRFERKRWYPEGKKRVPKDLTLTDLSVAIWFMDDGSLSKKGKTIRSLQHVSFATSGFYKEDLFLLVEKLKEWCGEEAIIDSQNNIRFKNQASQLVLKRINRFIHPSMFWKRTDWAEPFDYQFFENIKFPEVEIDYFLKKKIFNGGPKTTVYCIDVEDTHNFVTYGGIVHNCKPHEIEQIHWAAGGINKNVIIATCYNSFENWDNPMVEDIAKLLTEEFNQYEVDRVYDSIKKHLDEVKWQHEFSKLVMEEYNRLGISILVNKNGVMREMSAHFNKNEMNKVYSVIMANVVK